MPPEFENYFCYSAMWAFGGTLVEEHRPCFSQWWREQWNDYVMLPGDEEVSSKVIFKSHFKHERSCLNSFPVLKLQRSFFCLKALKARFYVVTGVELLCVS